MSTEQAPNLNNAFDNLENAMNVAAATGVRDVSTDRLEHFADGGKTQLDDAKEHGIGYTYVGGGGEATLVAAQTKARIDRTEGGNVYKPQTGEMQGAYTGSELRKKDEVVKASGLVTVDRHVPEDGTQYRGYMTGERAAKATEIISRRAARKIGQTATQRAVSLAESYTVKQ